MDTGKDDRRRIRQDPHQSDRLVVTESCRVTAAQQLDTQATDHLAHGEAAPSDAAGGKTGTPPYPHVAGGR